jgi:hypothetical protein
MSRSNPSEPANSMISLIIEDDGRTKQTVPAERSGSNTEYRQRTRCGPRDPRPNSCHIVVTLIRVRDHTLELSKIQEIVGGNRNTVNRQTWTLASNAPDLQQRLRGWVFSPERGRYALTSTAIQQVNR